MISASAPKYRSHDAIDGVLSNVFSILATINELWLNVTMAKLKLALQCRRLYLDEAQEYLNVEKYGTFTGGTGGTGSNFRAILPPLLHIKDLVVSGTGLNLQEVSVPLSRFTDFVVTLQE